MSDISELETRITTALERISSGLAALPAQKAGMEKEMAQLKAALDEERVANGQLEERLKTVQQARADEVAGLKADIDRVADQLSTDAAVITRLRAANAELRSNNDALRAAIGAGVADADLVNRAMEAELGGLKATQAADRAELDAVLGELGQLIADNDPTSPSTQKEGTDA